METIPATTPETIPDRTALCDVCRERKPADTAEFYEMPMGGGNPYPETAVICAGCKDTDAAKSIRWAAEEAQHEENERQREREPRCTTCDGNAEDGYPCIYAHLYRPGECSQITGVW